MQPRLTDDDSSDMPQPEQHLAQQDSCFFEILTALVEVVQPRPRSEGWASRGDDSISFGTGRPFETGQRSAVGPDTDRHTRPDFQ